MKRRNFIKIATGLLSIPSVGMASILKKDSLPKGTMFYSPIHTSKNWDIPNQKFGFAREFLMTDFISTGCIARYENTKTWYIYQNKNTNLKDFHGIDLEHILSYSNCKEVLIPSYLYDWDASNSEELLKKHEDDILSAILFGKIINEEPSIFIDSSNEKPNLKSFNLWFAGIESNRYSVDSLMMNPNTYSYIKESLSEELNRLKPIDFANNVNCYDLFWGAKIHTFNSIPEGYIVFSAGSEYNGVISVRQKKTKIRDSKNNIDIFYKEQGLGVYAQEDTSFKIVKLY